MGLTNMLGGLIINICMKTWFASCSFEYITAFYVMQVKAGESHSKYFPGLLFYVAPGNTFDLPAVFLNVAKAQNKLPNSNVPGI